MATAFIIFLWILLWIEESQETLKGLCYFCSEFRINIFNSILKTQVPGEPGLDGVPGRAGADGIPGKDGVPGTDGKNGLNGKDGSDLESKAFENELIVL